MIAETGHERDQADCACVELILWRVILETTLVVEVLNREQAEGLRLVKAIENTNPYKTQTRRNVSMKSPILSLTLGFALLIPHPVLFASSTIYDGVIEDMGHVTRKEKIRAEDGTIQRKQLNIPFIKVRSLCSPYSSKTIHARIMTGKEGAYQTNNRMLTDFSSYFIDDVPVTMEDMAKVLKPGLRVATFENRSPWYFLHAETRNPDSQTGTLIEWKDGVVTLSRPQHKYTGRQGNKIENPGPDGATFLDDVYFPPLRSEVSLPETVEVIGPGGEVKGIESVGSYLKKPVFYQAERTRLRVELLPEGYGAWDLVTQNDSFLGGIKQMQYSLLFVNRSTERVTKPVNTQPFDQRDERSERLRTLPVFDGHLLAGWHPSQTGGPLEVPPYKGGSIMIDGLYTNRHRDALDSLTLIPGMHIVGTPRRGRMTPDSFRHSSEMPSAWGVVTAYDPETRGLTLKAPEIEGVDVSGEQTITLPEDVEYVRLGLPVEASDVLKEGALLKLFAPHPARLFVGK